MRVLLTTDFSENSWHAIRYAAYLFERADCEFYVLHAHQASPSGLVSTINKERDTRLHQITQDEASSKLHKLVAGLSKVNKVRGHTYYPDLVSDSLLNAVGRTVIDRDLDYICMGTQGASGVKEIFLGSNTVHIIKHIDFCPIIAVPQHYQFARPDLIVFATDFKHSYERVEIEPLIDIVKLWKARLQVIHIGPGRSVKPEDQSGRDALAELLRDIPFAMEDLDYHPSTSYRINEWVEQHKANMIAMIRSEHGFLERLLREPVIEKIAFRTQVPFLVLPAVK